MNGGPLLERVLKADGAFLAKWAPQKRIVIAAIEEAFKAPPYNLGQLHLDRLSLALEPSVKHPRRRAQRLASILERLNGLRLDGEQLICSPIPSIPLPVTGEGVIPRDPAIIALSGALEHLVEAILESKPADLRALAPKARTALLFVLFVAEAAVAPCNALSAICTARRRNLRGTQWLWIPCSPASENDFSALYLRKAVRKLLAVEIYLHKPRRDDPLLLPRSHRETANLSRPVGYRATSRLVKDALVATFGKSVDPGSWWETPAARKRATKSPLQAWWDATSQEMRIPLTKFRLLQLAAQFRWYQKGLCPFMIRMLYLPALPAAPVSSLIKDKQIGYDKRAEETRYALTPGDPPKSPASPMPDDGIAPEVEVDAVEPTGVPVSDERWQLAAAHQVRIFVDHVETLRDESDLRRGHHEYIQKLELLRDRALGDLSKDFPSTSVAHFLVRWIAHRCRAAHFAMSSLRAYVSRFGPRHLFRDSVPIDMGDWTADDVYALVADFLSDSRAATTQFNAVGLLAEFIRYVQVVTSRSVLPEVRLRRGSGDLDFDRRVHLLSQKKLTRVVRAVARSRALGSVDATRAAFAILLMGGLGLRAVEAFSLTLADITLVDGQAILDIRVSKTRAGPRRLHANAWLNDEQMTLLLELHERLVSDPRPAGPALLLTSGRSASGTCSYPASRNKVLGALRLQVHGAVSDAKNAATKKGKRPKDVSLIDLHCLRHTFATHHLLELIEAICAGRHERSDALFVRLLKALGHRGANTIAIHYFHAGDQMRRLLLQEGSHGAANS
jgi:integrase